MSEESDGSREGARCGGATGGREENTTNTRETHVAEVSQRDFHEEG